MAEYIERKAAHDAVVDAIWHGKRSMYSVANAINSVPTADVATVRHGQWNVEWDAERDQKRLFVRIVCSNCGLKTGQKSNYCPNCGARMNLDVQHDKLGFGVVRANRFLDWMLTQLRAINDDQGTLMELQELVYEFYGIKLMEDK